MTYALVVAGHPVVTLSALGSPITAALDGGLFSLTGGDFDIVSPTVSLASGTFAITTPDTNIVYGDISAFLCETGDFDITGRDVTVIRSGQVDANAGTFSLSGGELLFSYGAPDISVMDAGSFSYSGSNIVDNYGGSSSGGVGFIVEQETGNGFIVYD